MLLALSALLLGLGSNAWAQGEADVVVEVKPLDQLEMVVANGLATDSSDADIGLKAAEILRNCFRISGYFKVLDISTMLPGLDAEGLSTTQFDQWYASGAQALVKFSYHTKGTALVFDFRLFDVVGGKEIRLQWDAASATPSQYRAAVYAFANAVLEYYTGESGIFGQEVLVVRKDKKKGETHVYRISVDGSSLSRVSTGSSVNILPAWGPGGAVMYTSYASGNPDLVMSSGDSPSTLSSAPGMNSGASYCPSKGLIAVTLSKDENPEIYVMDSSGGSLTRLTQNSHIDTSPSWSPDCSQIAFVSNRAGSPQIHVMNADGSGARAVTTVGRYNTSPSWSRGGKIAFTGRDEYNVFDIFTVDPDSGFVERLTQDQGHNEEPSWSPDGRYLAFTSTRDGASKLYIMTADGRFQTAITEGGGYETPAWAP
ncbi:MAG: translocation protein TolB [Myxococcota bacterium]|jgi:TolB protein|nr:translocation protein TolB [Myxococcota bacterium]